MINRRFITFVAAAAFGLAGLATTQESAMATKGQCNPAPDPYNVQTLAQGDVGEVLIEIRYGWDGVSVYPNCAGPLIRVHVENNGPTTYYAHLVGRKGTPVTVEILPGANRNYQGGQLASVGLTTLADVADLTLTTVP